MSLACFASLLRMLLSNFTRFPARRSHSNQHTVFYPRQFHGSMLLVQVKHSERLFFPIHDVHPSNKVSFVKDRQNRHTRATRVFPTCTGTYVVSPQVPFLFYTPITSLSLARHPSAGRHINRQTGQNPAQKPASSHLLDMPLVVISGVSCDVTSIPGHRFSWLFFPTLDHFPNGPRLRPQKKNDCKIER